MSNPADNDGDPLTLQLLPLMLDHSAFAFALRDLDGRYRLANRLLHELAGRGPNEIVGATDAELFPAAVAEALRRLQDRVVADDRPLSDEFALPIAGRASPHLVAMFPVSSGGHAPLSIGMVAVDITLYRRGLNAMHRSLERTTQINGQLREAMRELERLASIDRLTGAWNRRHLEESVAQEMGRCHRYHHPVSIALLDADHFKRINDRHGHSCGDRVLKRIAAAVRRVYRRSDLLARWGGEEFVVLLPQTHLAGATLLAERICQAVADAPVGPGEPPVTVSVGVAEYLPDEDWEGWLDRADRALYEAKQEGRNRVRVAAGSLAGPGAGGHFVRLVWHAGFESGHTLIDDQHRALFEQANALLGALLTPRQEAEVGPLVERLIDEVREHFESEERVLRAAGYAGLDDHAAAHALLLKTAERLVASFDQGRLAVGELFQFIAYELITRHILSADRAFFAHLP